MRHRLLPLLALLAALALPAVLPAQVSRADSAATLLRAARVLEARGEFRLARELLRVLADRFPETADAIEGRQVARQLAEDESLAGFNRAGFVAYHTVFGAWLGVIIPAALGADGEGPYGAGLLIGGPVGFLGSRALANSRPLTSGQAALIQFGSTWGTWQGLGWQQALDLGEGYECVDDFCWNSGSDTAPWVGALVGGVAGFGAGLLASRANITQGEAAVISSAAFWAHWYGVMSAAIADASEDDLLTAALVEGNVGLLVGIPAGRSWRPTAARVRTISAGGLAGAVAGLGVALLASVDDERGVAALPLTGSTLGLVAATMLTREPRVEGAATPGDATALLSNRDGWRLGMPMPSPAVLPAPAGSRRSTVPGVRIPVLHLTW